MIKDKPKVLGGSDTLIEGHDEVKKILLDTNKFDIEPNNDIFNKFTFDDLYNRFSKKFSLQRLIAKQCVPNMVQINQISNLTNCIDGPYHNFKNDNKTFICTRCNEEADPAKLIPDSHKLLYKKEIILYLQKLATKYCINGTLHKFDYNANKDVNICKKCKYMENSQVLNSDKELISMYEIIEKNKKDRNLEFNNYINKLKINNTDEIYKIKKLFDKIMYKYQKYDNDINKTINVVLDSVQKLLGTDIIINNKVYNLHHNIYYIDHDYNGAKLETPIQIYEKENKFRIIENHPHFKRTVLVYSMHRNTKYELFYDFLEKNL